jgi:hypothetical protein
MFGEYALTPTARRLLGMRQPAVCENLSASKRLKESAKTDAPYPGARNHYVIDDEMASRIPNFRKYFCHLRIASGKEKTRGKQVKTLIPHSDTILIAEPHNSIINQPPLISGAYCVLCLPVSTVKILFPYRYQTGN